MLLSVVLHAAAKDFYAVLSNGTVTFYYDDNKASRGGEDIYSTTPRFYAEATKAVMDASMADYAPSFMTTWFYGCSALTSIEGMEYLNTSEVLQMNGLFQGCSSLTSLDLTGFDTSNVTTMNGMFAGCSSLTELDLSSFNTSKVKDMGGIFAECSNLKTIYVDENKWSTAAVTSENGGNMALFYGCGPLVGGNGTKFSDTNKEDLDYACVDKAGQPGYLTHKAGPASGPASATAEPYAVLSDNYKVLTFYYDNQKAARNGMSVGPFKSEVDPSWYYNRESITSVVFDDSFAKCTTLTSTAYWFCIFRNLSSISGISNLKTDNVTDMSSMFSHCSSLTSLDVTGFNTGKVTSMRSMFINCSGLTSLDLSGFNTEHVELMSYMFQSCSGLTTIYIGDGWSTANVLYSCDLYMFTNCTSLVGGAGTVYDSKHADRTYARIDGGAENPGYFTDKNATPTPSADAEPYVVLSDNKVLTFYYDNQRAARGGSDIKARVTYNATYKSYSTATTASFDASFAKYRPTSTALWFCECSSLTAIEGMQYLNTDNVTDMHRMFDGCSSLTSLDVSGFNTEKVTSMGWMFAGCSSLTSLDLTGFKTDNVENMEGLFQACYGLTSLDLTGFKTDKVTNLKNMFHGCSGLTSLDLTGFTTDNVTDMSLMFYGCPGLKTIYAGDGWSTAKVTAGGDMFKVCSSLVGGAGTTYRADHTDHTYAHIDGGTDNPGYFTDKNATPSTGGDPEPEPEPEPYAVLSEDNTVLTFYYDDQKAARNGMGVGPFTSSYDKDRQRSNINSGWDEQRESITSVVFDESFANCTTLTSTACWFYGLQNLSSITGISNLKTDKVTDMCFMFYGCSGLTSLDVSGFKTDKVTNMRGLFEGCSSLTSLDVTGFKTDNVTNMSAMFYNCSSLVTIYVGDGWSTAKVVYGVDLFKLCPNLVGGAGTTYNTDHADHTYACIDGGASNPGYFTSKGGGASPTEETITVSSAGQTTWCSDKDLDFTGYPDLKAYVATGYDKASGTIWLTRVKEVPANTGFLLMGEADTYEIPVKAGGLSAYYQNMFKGTLEATTIYTTDGDYTNYYLSNGESGVGFYKVTKEEGVTLGKNRAYLSIPTEIPAVGTAGSTETIKVTAAGQVPYYNTESLDFSSLDAQGVKAYTATGYDYNSGTIWLTRVKQVPAKTGILIMAPEGEYPVPTASISSVYANMFRGTLEGITIQTHEEIDGKDYINYYLSSGASGVGFYRVTKEEGVQIKANRCYLPILNKDAAAGTRSVNSDLNQIAFEESDEVIGIQLLRGIGGDEDGTTSIKDLTPALSEGEGEWYTLQGQRVAKPGKGLYIRNGKMVIVR